uniref:Uncharacterized protein n=1 Tax=Rhizophora mucronata TaxID=61149 RepID=A0A2P2QH04_RHIMU
MCTPAVFAGIT